MFQKLLIRMAFIGAILASFVFFVFYVLLPALDSAREDAPRAQARVIARAVQDYYTHNDKYPENLEELTKPDPNNADHAYLSPDAILDPWQHPYKVEFPEDEGGKVRIYTISPKGKTLSNLKE